MSAKKERPSRAKPGAKKGGSKPDGPEALRKVLACKVTSGEREAVTAAAKAAGLSESAWMRRTVQEALGLAQFRQPRHQSVVSFWVTEVEEAALRRVAEEAGVSVSKWAQIAATDEALRRGRREDPA